MSKPMTVTLTEVELGTLKDIIAFERESAIDLGARYADLVDSIAAALEKATPTA